MFIDGVKVNKYNFGDLAFFFCIGCLTGCFITIGTLNLIDGHYIDGVHSIQQQAIDHGYGHMEVGSVDGKPEFKWNNE